MTFRVDFSDSNSSLVNESYAAAVGQSPSFFTGKNHFDLYSSKENEAIFNNVISTGESFTVYAKPFSYPDDIACTTYWNWTLNPVRGTNDQIEGVLLTLQNVTEQKKAELELARSQVFLENVIENIPDMIFVKDAQELRFVRFNKAGEDLLGYSREDLIGKNDHDLFSQHEADYFTEKDREVLSGTTVVEIPIESILTKDRGTRLLHTKKIPIFDENGKPEYLLGLSADITDRIRYENEKAALERQLHQSQKLESIGRMAGGVAHDLNNILSGIVGYPDLILDELPSDSDLVEPIQAIRESGIRAAHIVADLLTVARGVASTKEVSNLNDLIKKYLRSPELEHLIQRYPKVRIQHNLSDQLSNIKCSPVHIRKCLMNLITNAIEACSEGGDVSLITQNKHIDLQSSRLFGVDQGEYVQFIITDTGNGISSKDIDHIFEPFYTKKAMGMSGTGLGLSIVWSTIKDHMGGIKVRSNEDGTTFEFVIPSSSEDVEDLSKDDGIISLSGNSQTILVVDDEIYQQNIATKMLKKLNYRVFSVGSGEDAIKYIQKNGQIDLIILDMIMFPGMSGYETYKEIIKIAASQKALITSGFSESLDVENAKMIGARLYLKKPYTIEQLGHAVRRCLSAD